MYFKFWGTRGSIPVPGKSTFKYGGNTPCVEIRSSKDKLIILDAGSGIREFGNHLLKNKNDSVIDIFFSHYHWDHIQGIPFFAPLYQREAVVNLYGETCGGERIKDILGSQMASHYFPIELDDMSAKTTFNEIEPNKKYDIDGIKIETFRANHSSPTISFKFTEGEKSFIYLTDNELKLNELENGNISSQLLDLNKEIIDFCRGADYLIHDSMYDEALLMKKKGWGHSSNVTLAYFSILSSVKNLILFHYNPDYTDDKIDELLKETRLLLKAEKSEIKCLASMEGLRIDL